MKILIGLDPGASTGVAVFKDGVLSALDTITPVQLGEVIAQSDHVVFEDSRLQSVVWGRGVSSAAAAKIARNVGEIDAWCKLIIDLCERHQKPVNGISPKHKGAKTNAQDFNRITGWSRPSNQHSRDAAMVAWPYRSTKI